MILLISKFCKRNQSKNQKKYIFRKLENNVVNLNVVNPSCILYIYCVQWNHKILVRERESAIFNSYLLTHWVYIYPESVMDLRTSILAEKCEVSIGLLFASPLYFSSLSKINSNKGRPWRYIRMKTIGALWCITRRHAQVLIYYFYDTCNLTGIYDYLYKFNL